MLKLLCDVRPIFRYKAKQVDKAYFNFAWNISSSKNVFMGCNIMSISKMAIPEMDLLLKVVTVVCEATFSSEILWVWCFSLSGLWQSNNYGVEH